jgi:hypothetical protein
MVGITTVVHPGTTREILRDAPVKRRPATSDKGGFKADRLLPEPSLIQLGEIERHLV